MYWKSSDVKCNLKNAKNIKIPKTKNELLFFIKLQDNFFKAYKKDK